MVQCWLRYKNYSPQMGVDHVPLQDFTIDLMLTLSMYKTTEGMEVQFCPRYEGQLNHMAESTPSPPPSGPFPRTSSRHSSLLHGRAKTDRLD